MLLERDADIRKYILAYILCIYSFSVSVSVQALLQMWGATKLIFIYLKARFCFNIKMPFTSTGSWRCAYWCIFSYIQMFNWTNIQNILLVSTYIWKILLNLFHVGYAWSCLSKIYILLYQQYFV